MRGDYAAGIRGASGFGVRALIRHARSLLSDPRRRVLCLLRYLRPFRSNVGRQEGDGLGRVLSSCFGIRPREPGCRLRVWGRGVRSSFLRSQPRPADRGPQSPGSLPKREFEIRNSKAANYRVTEATEKGIRPFLLCVLGDSVVSDLFSDFLRRGGHANFGADRRGCPSGVDHGYGHGGGGGWPAPLRAG